MGTSALLCFAWAMSGSRSFDALSQFCMEGLLPILCLKTTLFFFRRKDLMVHPCDYDYDCDPPQSTSVSQQWQPAQWRTIKNVEFQWFC